MAQSVGYFQHYSTEERKILPEFVDLNVYRYPKDYNTIGKMLKNENHDVVMLRAGIQAQNANTSTTDTQFTTSNVAKYRDAGLRIGTYYYARHINTYTTNGGWTEANAIVDATSHANNYADILEAVLGSGNCGDMVPCIDFEDNRIYDNVAYVTTAQILYVWLKAFNDRMKVRFPSLSGCMLYTAYYYVDACSSTDDIRHSVDGGIANIYPYLWFSANACETGIHSAGTSVYPNYNYTLFGDYTKWTMWQYASDRDFLSNEFGLNVTSLEHGIDINVFDSFNYDLENIMIKPVIKPVLLSALDSKSERNHTHKGDYLPLQGGSLTGKTNVVNPDALVLKQEQNKSWKLGRTSTSIANTHVAGDLQFIPSTDYWVPGSTLGETYGTSKIVFKEDASIECTGVKVGGNNVLTTASIISDIATLNSQAYETEMTNAIDGMVDLVSLNGSSAFNQISDATFTDVPNWNTALTNVTAISDAGYLNSMYILATASTGEHFTDRYQHIKDTVPLQNGRQYFIIVKFNIRGFARLKIQLHVKNVGGTYDIYDSNIPTNTTNDWVYLKTPVLSVNAVPDIRFRFYLLSGSNAQNWTTTGVESVSVTEPKIIDLTACGLASLSEATLLEMFKQSPTFRYRSHVNNLIISTLNSAKTSIDNITLDSLGITSLKSLSSTIYDSYNEDTKTLTRRVATVSGLANNATINSTTCPGIKSTTGIFFAYNANGEYTYGVVGATLAFTSGNVTVDYELGTATTSTITYGANLQCWTNGYLRLSGSIIPYTTIKYPRNLAGAVNNNSAAILVNDNNIQALSTAVSTNKAVAKSTTGDEYIRFIRVKTVKGTGDPWARILYKIDLSHTGSFGKSGELQFFFYKQTGHGSLLSGSYAWIINDTGMSNPFASGDVIYQNWIPSSGTTGFTDIYVKAREYASIYYAVQHSLSENSSSGGSNTVEFLPSGDTLISSIPATSSTLVIDGVLCTAEASVNATVINSIPPTLTNGSNADSLHKHAQVTDSNATTGAGQLKLYTCTQAEYDAIVTKDSSTLYFIK